MSRIRVAACVAAILLACMRADLAGRPGQTAAVDREYVLEATMLGYRGVGGEIDGVRNPTLWARTGEAVRITMVNGETMVHDVVLEKLGIKSAQILDKGATTNITFKASQSDTYFCSLPGHREAGMAGRLEVSDQPRQIPEGAAPVANGRPLNLDFENGTLNDWTAAGDAFELVKTEGENVTRNGHAGTYWISSAVGGSARKGTLSSVPFTVTHPYASFLVSGGAFDSTRVELVSADTNTRIYSISGADNARFIARIYDKPIAETLELVESFAELGEYFRMPVRTYSSGMITRLGFALPLVAADGGTAAIRGSDGRLALLHRGRDSFAVKDWLAADGDGERDFHEGKLVTARYFAERELPLAPALRRRVEAGAEAIMKLPEEAF